MNILGLIVEYNPFHNGHLYHLNKSKETTGATHSIAVMSGNFLQRGEPALFDKYTRAEMAVRNGVDLVVELPTLYACQSAEIFSHGAITLLNSLNSISSVCFGSECGSVEILNTIASILVEEPEDFKILLKKYLDDGMLFPSARSNALFDFISSTNDSIDKEELTNILNSSNNILGIEYLKSLIKLKSPIKPYTITRVNSEYNSEKIEGSICSATAIRKVLKNSSSLDDIEAVVPLHTYNTIHNKLANNFSPMFDDNYFETLSNIILRDQLSLNKYFEVNEGIENKIYNNIFTSNSLEDLLHSIKSKRYTMTKLKRTLNNILLGVTKEDILKIKDLNQLPYVRVLAFNDKGREILKEIKTNSDIIIVNKFSTITNHLSDDTINTLVSYDIKSSNLYNQFYYKNNKSLLKGPMDYFISPFYLR